MMMKVKEMRSNRSNGGNKEEDDNENTHPKTDATDAAAKRSNGSTV